MSVSKAKTVYATGSKSQQRARFSPRLFNLSIQENGRSSYPDKLVMNLVYEQCAHAAARWARVRSGRALGCRMHSLWSGAGQPHPFTGSGAPPGGRAPMPGSVVS